MYKDYRYINAGENEFYRWGKKAQAKVEAYLIPNEDGFLSMPADGGKYFTIGTSKGKYGEFAKFDDVCLSVNSIGRVWAKIGTPKADTFIKMINQLLNDMKLKAAEHLESDDYEDEIA